MDTYVKLAKAATECFVRQHTALTLPRVLPPELTRQRACYVYLYENPGRRLRAMSGAPLPHQTCLGQEIISHTITALAEHTRSAVRRADLPSLVYVVAVLDPLQRISDAAQLNPDQYGLYLRSDQGHSAVLMPKRTGITTAQDQIATALRESGANPRHAAITMYRFGVTYYE